jgi:hypothetical protein
LTFLWFENTFQFHSQEIMLSTVLFYKNVLNNSLVNVIKKPNRKVSDIVSIFVCLPRHFFLMT